MLLFFVIKNVKDIAQFNVVLNADIVRKTTILYFQCTQFEINFAGKEYVQPLTHHEHVLLLSFRWFHQGPNPFTGGQDWIYSGNYWDRNYFNLPDIY